MPEMDLRQPGFTYSSCEPFTKNKEWRDSIWGDSIWFKKKKKRKEIGDSKCI